MKYYIDQEFIEGFHKPLFGKRRHFIDLISIGIRCEDGRELHLISSEYEYSKANQWVRQNVIRPLYLETVPGVCRDGNSIDAPVYVSQHNFHKAYGISNKEIAQRILEFTRGGLEFAIEYNENGEGIYYPEFIAYYADYDWVLLCSLFGTMLDLPKGFPMYCIDLKQRLDEKVRHYAYVYKMGFEDMLVKLKADPRYPVQENEHSAIADARWNEQLAKFIEII